MSAICLSRPAPARRPNGLLWLIVLAISVGVLVSAQAVNKSQHAEIKHGQEAQAVRQCLQDGGILSVWQRPNGRVIRLCQLETGKFGLQILEPDDKGALHEITTYIKNKMTRLDQVIRYLTNSGAKQIWP